MNKGFWKLSLACVLVLGCLTTVPALAKNSDSDSDTKRPPHRHAVRDTDKNDSVRPERHRSSTDKDGTVRGERRNYTDRDNTVNNDRRHRSDKDSTVDRNHRHRYSDRKNSTRTSDRRNYSENARDDRYRDNNYNYNGNVRNDNRYNDFTGTKARVRRGYMQDGREVEIIDYGNTGSSNSRYSRDGRYSRDRTVDRVTSNLNLSDSQKRRMEPYIRDMYDRFDKSSVGNNRDYNNSRNREAFRNFKDRVSPNLTDEQRKKLDRMDIRDILR
ncbi:hypothetical protein IJT10_08125 [bacterium]|nr:hypothetical protein [bacterium]